EASRFHSALFYPASYAPLFSLFSYQFFFSSRRRHTSSKRDWSSDVCSSDLNLLHHILICLGRRLCRFLADSFDACVGSELVVKYGHIISYNYLILPCLCECSFYCRNLFNGLLIPFLRFPESETHSRHPMGKSLDVSFPADQL